MRKPDSLRGWNSMNISKALWAVLLVLILLPGEAPGSRAGQQGVRRVVFEEVGQFNDGGMAVTVLVAGDLAYVCEFDRGLEVVGDLVYVADGSDGLEIIRFRKDGPTGE
jgi:hypothetical protein